MAVHDGKDAVHADIAASLNNLGDVVQRAEGDCREYLDQAHAIIMQCTVGGPAHPHALDVKHNHRAQILGDEMAKAPAGRERTRRFDQQRQQ